MTRLLDPIALTAEASQHGKDVLLMGPTMRQTRAHFDRLAKIALASGLGKVSLQGNIRFELGQIDAFPAKPEIVRGMSYDIVALSSEATDEEKSLAWSLTLNNKDGEVVGLTNF